VLSNRWRSSLSDQAFIRQKLSLLGGGKGAAIGALVGGAGAAGGQVYTGRKKDIPAEAELSFKLAQDLQMRPVRMPLRAV
jgi:hypothetical protein